MHVPSSSRLGACRGHQRLDLGVSETAPPPAGQIPQLERAEPDPFQTLDRVADGFTHPLDLAFAPLVDGDFERVGRDPAHSRRRGAAILEQDAVRQRAELGIAYRRAGHDDPVGLLDLEPRMGQPVRQLSLVGEQDQPGGVDVETPNRV